MWRTTGQPEVLSLLKNCLQTGNLAHAYLFVGPPHVGKTTLALDLAQALNCQGIEPPCGECQSCRRILSGKHADVTIIELNSSSNTAETKPRVKIGIDGIKELERQANLSPYEGKYKIFIIDGAENLSGEAANCFLKTLEEPPAGVIFILLTAEETQLLQTVVSRCQRLELKPMPNVEVENILVESRGIDSDRARFLARLSDGCLGWALLVSVDESYLQQRTQRLSELLPLLKAGWNERFNYAAQLENDRKTAEEVIKVWLTWWRDVMLVKCDCKQIVTNIDLIQALEEWAKALSLPEIKDFIASLQVSLNQISSNANQRLVFEVLMLDMPRKEQKTGREPVSASRTL